MAALCVFLAVACGYDYREKRIPNYLLVLTAVFGAAWRFWNGTFPDIIFYLGEAALVTALLYPFFKIGAVGAGDVKLLGVTAGYLPFEKILLFLFFSLLVGAIFSLFKMWKKKSFRKRWKHLREYIRNAAGNGSLQLYREKDEEENTSGICLSGPVLAGILLYLGGVY